MSKLLYCALFIALTALLACSGPETSQYSTGAPQIPVSEPMPISTTAPVEITAEVPAEVPVEVATEVPAQTETPTAVRAETPAPAAVPIVTEVPAPTEAAAPTEAPAQGETPPTAPAEMPAQPTALPETTPEPGTPSTPDHTPAGVNGTDLLTSDLSAAELSCLSEIGDPQQLLALMNNPELAPPQERDALVECLEHETLLKIFLKGFTDQTGPLSTDTSACVNAGFRNFDLRTMMLTSPEGPGGQAAMVKGMAGLLITLSCLNEEEWEAASPALDLQPEGREALPCVMNKLGGPEGVEASLESKEGEPPLAFFRAAAECGLMMMGGPPG